MVSGLPPFRPVTKAELRYIWTKYPECRRLVLEIERYRRVIAEIDSLYKTTHQAWRYHLGGNLTALHLLQQIMTAERERLPAKMIDADQS
ncbi:hypothetical protein QZH44_08485 [Pseudomonas corrugata]|uniref:hypothetical protein n=1 Tax=Pseudomonas corrugata TaxID=47879 RepID=UPI003D814052